MSYGLNLGWGDLKGTYYKFSPGLISGSPTVKIFGFTYYGLRIRAEGLAFRD